MSVIEVKTQMEDKTQLEEVFMQFREIAEQNSRMKAVIGNYIETANALTQVSTMLKDASETLKHIAYTLDPQTQKSVQRARQSSNKPYYEELYNLLKSGTQITTKFMETTYPDMDVIKIKNIFTAVRKMPNVKVRKDGRTAVLYI